MNKANEIVAKALADFDRFSSVYELVTDVEVFQYAIDMLHEESDKYDEDWFPLVATQDIRDTLNWDYITERYNDYTYEYNVRILFGN